MTKIGVRELRNRTADLVARAHAGEEIVVTNHGTPLVRLEPVRTELKPYLTREDLAAFPQADAGLTKDLKDLAGESTDDLGPIQ